MNRGRRKAWARDVLVSLACVLVFVGIGGMLPTLLPATGSNTRLPQTPFVSALKVLYFLDPLFPPSTSPESVRVLVNVATLVVWGVVFGALISVVTRWFARPPRE